MRAAAVLLAVMLLAGCGRQAAPISATFRGPEDAAEPEKIAVTRWTEKTELFMEYPPLIGGEQARFAVHLTNLNTFKPVTAGQVTVELRRSDGGTEAFTTAGPSRPGIFGVDVQPSRAGEYEARVRLSSPGLNDVHDAGRVTVHPNTSAAKSATTEKTAEQLIPFLKEQQWTLEFATQRVAQGALRESLRVPAEVRARTGGEADVLSPVRGRVANASASLAIGGTVRQGQALAYVLPPTGSPSDPASLELAVAEANTALQLARKDRERSERLLAVGAIPARRLDEARATEATAEARLKAARARLGQQEAIRWGHTGGDSSARFTVRAPIAGVVASVNFAPGANVEEGHILFRIVAIDPVYVVGHLPEAEAARLRQISGADIEAPALERPMPARRLVSTLPVVDPESRTLSVVYEVSNSARLLAVGQAVSLRLFTSAARPAPVVPESALIDDAGRPVLFVQVGGESFARRAVKLGSREGGSVQVLEGVQPGERVVTRGAYLLRLSALSSQIPAHGHVH